MQFDQYYSTAASLPTDINEPPPTYLPPEEPSIATEVEQLLPPLSPDLGPWEPSTLEVSPIDDELPQESTSDVNNRPVIDSPPERARNDANQDSVILETIETSVQVAETFVDSTRRQSDPIPTNTAGRIHDLARVLTDQLQQHHGCCRQCHRQRERVHEAQHTEHLGLGEYMDRVQADGGYPDVLSAATVARREDDLAGRTSAERKREIYTGINSATPDARPPHLCLAADHRQGCSTGVTFDVDSVVAFAHSLAVAKLGVRWNPTQMPVSDLRSSLHLDPLPVHYFGSDGRAHHVRRPVHKIPHYTFGRLVGFEDISLYFLFPRLFREEQQSSRLRDDDFRIWMDQVLLTAIYQHYEGSLVQHYPSSFDHSRLNATARGVEMRSRRVDPVAREQLLFYFLPPGALPLVWASIQEKIERVGLQQFLDLTILVQGKNLKTLTKADTWDGMMQQFSRHWDNAIDESHLSDHS
ncbi:hypothetical protein PENSUB_12554 [Penicillium subrubescens]|uniref:Uncharacterized protein n=1 Tax=Penicillium subrubescens TaxID=1316194 RepID=A0A1Q5SY66_9EURO|nr:hypothetical protein PENSUB_12554 [Penicillium subrubescens]